MSAADRARAIATAQVAAFMRKRKLALDDLIGFGGEDLGAPDTAEKARRVQNAWALMAQLGLRYADMGGDQ
jgi:hypothetical protein